MTGPDRTSNESDGNDREVIVLGHINGVYGVNGWVKVFSETEPRDNILGYSPWLLRQPRQAWREVPVLAGRKQGKGVVAQLQGCEDRDAARLLMGAEIAIYRQQLAPLESGEYYWADLQDLAVETLDGYRLGVVKHIFDTGANAVLVVSGERERLIPFIQGQTVINIDLQAGVIQVDWDPEF